MFPSYEPNTVLSPTGCLMGFARPGSLAAKLVHPDRQGIAVTVRGVFLQ